MGNKNEPPKPTHTAAQLSSQEANDLRAIEHEIWENQKHKVEKIGYAGGPIIGAIFGAIGNPINAKFDAAIEADPYNAFESLKKTGAISVNDYHDLLNKNIENKSVFDNAAGDLLGGIGNVSKNATQLVGNTLNSAGDVLGGLSNVPLVLLIGGGVVLVLLLRK